MTTIALSPTGVVGFPEGGGHWWVYLQYVLALQDLGCDVWWIERLQPGVVHRHLADPVGQLEAFGLAGKVLCYEFAGAEPRWLVGRRSTADRVIQRADALINFDYGAPREVVERFRRSALVDIDPGLLQHWMASGQLHPAPHDRWFTTGETVGTERARFPDAGRSWERVRPIVHLASWPPCPPPVGGGAYTTVTSWWGDEWMTQSDGSVYENNKRVTFLDYAELPSRTGLALELAAYFGGGGSDEAEPVGVVAELAGGDADDVRRLRAGGWRLRRSVEVAGSPSAYRGYVQGSRGEFSCVKPSCIAFQNAWVSDRTLCYLASARPAVVQDTGPSEYLPDGHGLLRFRTVDEAVEALARVEEDHPGQAAAARAVAETFFDSIPIVGDLLDAVLSETAVARTPARRSAVDRQVTHDQEGGSRP